MRTLDQTDIESFSDELKRKFDSINFNTYKSDREYFIEQYDTDIVAILDAYELEELKQEYIDFLHKTKYKRMKETIDLIENKVKRYEKAQTRYNGDSSYSHQLETEIDNLECKLERLKTL